MPAPAPAIIQEVIWKNDEVMRFACSLVRRALALSIGHEINFTTDIVPDSERGPMIGGKQGNGIAGSVVTMLQTAHVIEPVGIFQNGKFYPLREKSTRADAKSRWLNCYRLTGRRLAEEFLNRSEMKPEPSKL